MKILNLSIIVFSFLIFGCSKDTLDISKPTESSGNTLKSAVTCETPLITEQNITAGTVTSTFNDAGNQLTITYSTLNTDYCLLETHLDVQADPANFPQTKNGNPKVDQFAYVAHLGCLSEWTQVVDLNTVSGWSLGETVFIAANAIVKKTPGGKKEVWGQGLPFPGNNWAMYFSCQQPVFECGSTFIDSRDNQTYTTVQIGTQCWMAQNLNIGVKILVSAVQTNNSIIEKYCYNDDDANCAVYGGLYQWNEAMQYVTIEGAKGICPTGWYLPTDEEWHTMILSLDASAVLGNVESSSAGGKMKETGTTHWISPNTGATNSSGFTALPGGYHGYSDGGHFSNMGLLTLFWSSSEMDSDFAWERYLAGYGNAAVYRAGDDKKHGFSVRCLRDY